jgi:hypothetical protein
MTLRRLPLFLLLSAFLFTACEPKGKTITNFVMGERVDLGPFSYVVVESRWLTQLGEGFQIRAPQHRFLMITLSVVNRSNTEVSVPMLTLKGSDGQEFQESSDGTGVTQWLGILRSVAPTQNLQGRIVFDVPLSTFKLRLPDGGETGYQKYAWVDIPLSIDPDQVQAPLPTAAQP